MALKLVTGPATEPVTLAEAKAQCRIGHSDEDALITAYIVAGREYAETVTRRALITQTWDYVLDDWPDGSEIVLPMPALQSVTSVKYKDADGVEHTFDSANYVVDADSEPGRIVLLAGVSWPSTALYAAGAVRVRFVAGWTAAAVPQAIRQTILLMVGHWYENREATVADRYRSVQSLPLAVDDLLWTHRVLSWP